MAKTKENKEQETRIETIFGWKNPEEVAEEIWKTSADNLLKGDLIFAYKNSGSDGIEKLVISYNFTTGPDGKKTWTNFGIYMKTKTWSCVIPHVTIGYLEEVVLKDLNEYKVDKSVLGNYKLILQKLKENGN